MFIQHKDGLNILEKITQEEHKARNEKFGHVIDFIKRRDLERKFLNNYELKKKEIWKFANSTEMSLEENSSGEEEEFPNNEENQDHTEEMKGNEEEKQIINQDTLQLEHMNIDSSIPLSKAQEDNDCGDKVLLFVKQFQLETMTLLTAGS
mmetsp:Transcript_29998/g.29239  ORF Transcript_29998/g.29239 Transcript_29998/m.29239 type:complete len:150 (+) Transcript_29998:1751-2200(+)